MRKEIIGILLFFLVVFSLISLLSYSPADPSIHHARATGPIHNIFGPVGAHFAGLLIGLFGLGASWIPILLLFLSIHFFGDQPGRAAFLIVSGGILLVIALGGLLSIPQDYYRIFGNEFSSGGIVGIFIKRFLVNYFNVTGSILILILLLIVGFILTTGFSLVRFAERTWQLTVVIADPASGPCWLSGMSDAKKPGNGRR